MASRSDLDVHLREQLSFLEASARAYDNGFDGEAKRLAVTIRLLLHQTGTSHALLEQMGVRNAMRWWDTAKPLGPPAIAIMDFGLVSLKMAAGGPDAGASYVALLGNRPPERAGWAPTFDNWWTRIVLTDDSGRTWSRKQFIVRTANKEGGAHVDPALTASYEALVNDNAMGATFSIDSGPSMPVQGNLVLASVRQIAYEVDRSIRAGLSQHLT